MKRFVRTTAGKTLLFFVCIVSVLILAGSVLAGAFLLQGEFGFYTKTEQQMAHELAADHIHYQGYGCVWAALNGDEFDEDGNSYYATDGTGKVLYRSYGVTAASPWEYTLVYGVIRDESGGLSELYYIGDTDAPVRNGGDETVTVRVIVPEQSEHGQTITLIGKAVHLAYYFRYSVYPIGIAALLLAVISFIALMSVAGRRPDSEELYPGPLNPVPFDLLLGICLLAGIGLAFIIDDLGSVIQIAAILALVALAVGLLLPLGLGLCMSAAVRIKQRTLVRKSLIGRCMILLWKCLCWLGRKLRGVLRWFWELIRSIPLIWKTVLITGALSVLELVWVLTRSPGMYVIERILLVPLILWFALGLRKLQKAGAALAAGDLSYQTDTKKMLFRDLKKHGENLNSIAGGMSIAVEERLKSERMKTELITNVSHDIKTPLTSVINYASLIAAEPCDNEKITEYSGVLIRQSEKLKRLIDDLVEASKASTGNLDVFLAPCDASVFISQAAGEYEEKMKKAALTLITKQPEKEVRIMADGRRMWRIFDNLMNNICKYAQPDTRVYLTLEEQAGSAVITFKNTSREELDMTEEELMERFTRGDASRNTEGNGLGLAIAKSMAELQGGKLSLSTDGDLFKAVLTFPTIQ